MAQVEVVQALEARRDKTVEAMHGGLLKVDGYVDLDRKIHHTLIEELHYATTFMLDFYSRNTMPTDSELEVYREIGRTRGMEEFSIADMRTGFNLAFIAGMQYAFSIAESVNQVQLMDLSAFGRRTHTTMLDASELAYFQVFHNRGKLDPVRAHLTDSLLNGKTDHSLAEIANETLANSYLVALCQDPYGQGVTTSSQRDIAQNCLRKIPGALWKGDFDSPRGLIALIPFNSGSIVSVREITDGILTDIREILNRNIVSAAAFASSISQIPEAVKEAANVLRIARAIPETNGRTYYAEELSIELSLLQNSRLRRRLENVLHPLRSGTDLLVTLEALFENGLDRERTAQALFVHRRTLTYRIQKIRDLSGIDPLTPHGIALLRSALTASKLSNLVLAVGALALTASPSF